MTYLTSSLKRLDESVKMKTQPKVIGKYHEVLLDGLRKTGKKGYLHDTPDWDMFPVGRDFFLQNLP